MSATLIQRPLYKVYCDKCGYSGPSKLHVCPQCAQARKAEACRKAIEFLIANYKRRPTTSEIAANTGYSPFHFLRMFHEECGTTIGRLICELAVWESKELLMEGRPCSEIAKSLGFSHQSHFTQVFKKITGTTPVKWRNNQPEKEMK